MAAVIWGWGVAQYPVLLPGTAVTLTNAGAPQATLVALVVLFVAAVVLVGPAFALLFYLQGRRLLHADDVGDGAGRRPGQRGTAAPATARPAAASRRVWRASGPRSSAWSSSMPSSVPSPPSAAESSAG